MRITVFMKCVILFSVISLFAFSCTTTMQLSKDGVTAHKKGVWHRVEEGQTLWRIAKTYRVSLEELKEANDIEDVVHIASGTWIFIPGAEKVLYVQGNTYSSPQEYAKFAFSWPVKGEVVKPFGKHENDFNYGIDVRTKGTQNVLATQKGTIVFSNVIRGYGNIIVIEHENDFCSFYSRNIKSYVQEGQKVEKNTIIARVDSAKSPQGAVIHYELFYKGKPVNPLYYLP